MTPDRLDDWHRLFGLTLTDVFSDTPWQVELEKDLAMQRQRLDVVIIEQTAPDGSAADLPDGFDALRRHNLLTYKSKQEPLRARLPDGDRIEIGGAYEASTQSHGSIFAIMPLMAATILTLLMFQLQSFQRTLVVLLNDLTVMNIKSTEIFCDLGRIP
jgi:multidrug efflux pump subunit AcrB